VPSEEMIVNDELKRMWSCLILVHYPSIFWEENGENEDRR
jgi:hypothetical protein